MKKYGNWIFLALMVCIYLFLLVVKPELTRAAFNKSISIIIEILPIILVVLVVNYLIALYLKPKKVLRYLGKQAGIKGWLISIISGILSMGPIYAWYPTLKELREKGMKDGFIASFIYSRSIKLPLLPVMIYYFGLPLVVLLNLMIVIFSIINGLLVELFSTRLSKKQT